METRISVIITAANEQGELDETIRSIRDTAGSAPEIIVVDDCSCSHLTVPSDSHPEEVVMIHNRFRCGVGPSRHIGALASTGTHLLITDAHMRFTHGWHEAAIARVEDRPNTLHCGVCLGLDCKNMDVTHPNAIYYGATFNFFGPDQRKPGTNQVLEGVWQPEQAGDDYELACAMGAIYFWPRDWFLLLSPLRHLRSWGVDEQIMSLKAWLSGGDIRIIKDVRVGHKFRSKGEKPPFSIQLPHVIYNKLFTILTCIPEPHAEALISKFKHDTDFKTAWAMIRQDWHLVAQEQLRNSHLFTRDFDWFLGRFSLSCP